MKKWLAFLCLFATWVTSCQKPLPTLHIFTWSDYIHPEVIAAFEKRHGCFVSLDYYDSNEALYAKLKAGASGYDLIFPSSYYLELLHLQDMLQEIDLEKIPHLSHIDTTLFPLQHIPFSVGLPYMMSTSLLAVRSDRISDPLPSWDLINRKDLSKRITLLNDPREVLGSALKFLGYSLNSTDPQEIDQATEVALHWKKNIAKFEGEPSRFGFASAEYLMIHTYSGSAMRLQRENLPIQAVYPKEGGVLSCEYVAIPKAAPHPELAHAFLNHLFSISSAKANMEFVLELCPLPQALALLPEELRQSPIFFPSPEILEKAEIIQDVGEGILLYRRAWDRIKSGDSLSPP